MRTILVTGGAGFIGSNFIHYLYETDPDVRILNLDALTYAGNLNNLSDIPEGDRYHFIRGDIRDRSLLGSLFEQYPITGVIHFAAESHVDRSIVDPEHFLSVNVLGTQALLDTVRRAWSLHPDDKYCRDYLPGVRYLQISTDEVYGALGPEGLFTESTPLAPNSPYSSAKASADLIVRAYAATFGLPVNITRCSNNYGPYQFPEKLIPLMIHNCMEGRPLPVYGDGMQIRDWLHVLDHCRAIWTVFTKGTPGEVYNIGGNNEKANLEIVRLILSAFGLPDSMISFVKDRPGHDRRYAIDSTKIQNELGWHPLYTFEQGISETIDWYRTHQAWMDSVLTGDYRTYYEKMYAQ